MALSGSIDYNLTALELITAAYRSAKILRAGQSPSTDQVTVGMEALNIIIKSLQNRGLNLYALEKGYLFLNNDQHEYPLSTSRWVTSDLIQTTAAISYTAASNEIEVISATGLSSGDYFGVLQDDGTIHWTTIFTIIGSVIYLNEGTTGAVTAGNKIFSYLTNGNRFMAIDRAILRNKDDTDIPVEILPLERYANMTPKTSDGKVLQIYYDPQISAATVYVWPETSINSDYLVMWVQKTLDDIDASSNDLAFPQEWYRALRYQLAAELAAESETPLGVWDRLNVLAMKYLDEAEAWDTEHTFQIVPDTDWTRQ